ncbi:MAG: alanine dehydrogenase, partial [Chloroflexi bacterium]|nr:alanine dehydrogenase [Chloroflexota bacterium]
VTSHSEPTHVVDGVIHYGVPNMPGAVPRTSTQALCNATLPYVLRLANEGLGAVARAPDLARGVNTHRGAVTYQAVAEAFGLPCTPLAALL